MRRFLFAICILAFSTTVADSQQWLKQSTPTTVKIGPFVDSLDGDTEEAGLIIKKADIRLSKNGGDYAPTSADQGASDAGAPHDELGEYDISLNATDTNTAGALKIIIKESGALRVWKEFMVVSANAYDPLVSRVYGPLLLRGTVTTVNSQTSLELDESVTASGSFLGCRVVIRDATGGASGVFTGTVTAYSTTALDFDPDGTPPFTIAVGDIVEVLPPAFGKEDRELIDTEVAAIKTKADFLPSATAGAAGGLFIAGTNAPVTITGSGTALTIDSTGGNGHGVLISGDGSGDGMQINSGPTGGGLAANGNDFGIAATSTGSGAAHGFWAAASTGSGHGIFSYAGGSGHAIRAEGSLSVNGATTLTGNVAMQDGLTIARSTSNQSGLTVTGNGTGHGALFTSGSGATGNGIQATAASTSGSGLALTGTGTGSGLSGNIAGNLSGSVGSVTGSVGSVTGAVGSVTGSVGSISGITFPANFAGLIITSGRVNADVTHVLGDPVCD